jgi:hypothetical protein
MKSRRLSEKLKELVKDRNKHYRLEIGKLERIFLSDGLMLGKFCKKCGKEAVRIKKEKR